MSLSGPHIAPQQASPMSKAGPQGSAVEEGATAEQSALDVHSPLSGALPPAARAPRGGFVQPRLEVGPVDDAHEREADSVADQVVQRLPMSGATPAGISTGTAGIQRKCAACEDDEVQRKPLIQAKAGPVGGIATPQGFGQQMGQSQGAPLDRNIRRQMESGFGRDFGDVRIHTGSQAARLSARISARAFTHGQDIFFNQGEYQPGTQQGKHLLAHELTHTVQQGGGGGRIQRAIKTEDCTPAQAETLRLVTLQARAMLSGAITRLSASPVSASTQAIFKNHFGPYTDSHRDTVVKLFGEDKALLDKEKPTYQCEDHCNRKAPAYTYWIFGDIHLCPSYFNKPLNEMAETMVHEIHHLYHGHLDLGYHQNNHDNDASWVGNRLNADAFSELMQDLYEQP